MTEQTIVSPTMPLLAFILVGKILAVRATAAERRLRFREAYELFVRAARAHDRCGAAATSDNCRFRYALKRLKHGAVPRHYGRNREPAG